MLQERAANAVNDAFGWASGTRGVQNVERVVETDAFKAQFGAGLTGFLKAHCPGNRVPGARPQVADYGHMFDAWSAFGEG